MLRESFKMSWQNIVHNKMRSFLTMLGIVIGVTAIIALITIVEGVSNEVTSQFTELGAGKITVNAHGTLLKQGLNDNELKRLSDIDYVSGVSPTVNLETSAVRRGQLEETVAVEGKNEIYFKSSTIVLKSGRSFSPLDIESRNKVCIINEKAHQHFFAGEDPVGQTIQLNGFTYTVIGVLDDENTTDMMASLMGSSSDYKFIIPYTCAMKMTGANHITSLEMYVTDPERADDVISASENILNQAFNYREDSYRIMNLDSLLDTMNTMTGMMTTMLAGIASIALLVGGIGIMNMMLVSVTERTKEIGLRKALGAEPKRIQLQFLMESIVLSLIGGLIGMILGVLISWIVSAAIGFSFALSIGAISLGVGFSALVGIIFGWAPARKASMLNPIDALRSE